MKAKKARSPIMGFQMDDPVGVGIGKLDGHPVGNHSRRAGDG